MSCASGSGRALAFFNAMPWSRRMSFAVLRGDQNINGKILQLPPACKSPCYPVARETVIQVLVPQWMGGVSASRV